jgi:MtN3 and saliva related transmembrane protein
MFTFTTLIGLAAACCTTASYIPQLKKCWDTGETEDLSFKMLLILSSGIALWVVYGILQRDWVIILANCVSLLLLFGILFFKLREMRGGRRAA